MNIYMERKLNKIILGIWMEMVTCKLIEVKLVIDICARRPESTFFIETKMKILKSYLDIIFLIV